MTAVKRAFRSPTKNNERKSSKRREEQDQEQREEEKVVAIFLFALALRFFYINLPCMFHLRRGERKGDGYLESLLIITFNNVKQR